MQRALLEEFDYEALESCAADGSCQLACPVGIDTGELVKELRSARHTERAEALALLGARKWRGSGGRRPRCAAPRCPTCQAQQTRARAARARLGAAAKDRSARARPLSMSPPAPTASSAAAGPAGSLDLAGAIVAISERAGMAVWIPDRDAGGLLRVAMELEGF